MMNLATRMPEQGEIDLSSLDADLDEYLVQLGEEEYKDVWNEERKQFALAHYKVAKAQLTNEKSDSE